MPRYSFRCQGIKWIVLPKYVIYWPGAVKTVRGSDTIGDVLDEVAEGASLRRGTCAEA